MNKDESKKSSGLVNIVVYLLVLTLMQLKFMLDYANRKAQPSSWTDKDCS